MTMIFFFILHTQLSKFLANIMKSSFFLEKIEGTTDVDHSFLFKTSDHTLFMMLNSEIVHMYLALDLRP